VSYSSDWNWFEQRVGMGLYVSVHRERKAGKQKRRMSAIPLVVGFAWSGAMPAFSASRSGGIQFHQREDKQPYSVNNVYMMLLVPGKRKVKRSKRPNIKRPPRLTAEQLNEVQG
jgi:hypothetical protein